LKREPDLKFQHNVLLCKALVSMYVPADNPIPLLEYYSWRFQGFPAELLAMRCLLISLRSNAWLVQHLN